MPRTMRARAHITVTTQESFEDEVEDVPLSTRPPTPPPIPPRPETKSRVSPFVMKLRAAPPGYFFQSVLPPPPTYFHTAPTGSYFFYGTLMDPSMLTEILNLEVLPELRPATVTGYACKLWGQYPALIDGATGANVEGAVYKVATRDHGEKLAYYETKNYATRPCIIEYTDGKEPARADGWTFVFVGNKRDLSEGEFDLMVWLKRMGRTNASKILDGKKNGVEAGEKNAPVASERRR